MKRFVVEQTGMVQLDAARQFVVEVPDHFTEEQAEEMLSSVRDTVFDEAGIEWSDDQDRRWLGYDVEIDTTDVSDPDSVAGGPGTGGLKVIKLGENK